MKTSTILVLLTAVVAIFLLLAPMRVKIGSEDMTTLNAATEAFSTLMSHPAKRIPASVLEGALAIAVIPGAFESTMPKGGGFSQGILIVRSKDGTWSGPSFVLLNELSSEPHQQNDADAILIINSRHPIEALADKGSLPLGAQASISDGPIESSNRLLRSALRSPTVYSYFHGNIQSAHRNIQSGVLNIDNNLNSEFYSREGITLNEIIAKEGVRIPNVARRFTCLVSTYTNASNKCG